MVSIVLVCRAQVKTIQYCNEYIKIFEDIESLSDFTCSVKSIQRETSEHLTFQITL